jgi:hypothetical protein
MAANIQDMSASSLALHGCKYLGYVSIIPVRYRRLYCPILSPIEIRQTNCIARHFRAGPMFADIRVYPPWPPLRSRLFGARKRNLLLCARRNRPSPFLVFHHCWPFLYPNDRLHLCSAFPIMLDYAKLRLYTASESLALLQATRPAANNDPINKQQSWRISVALLHFNFDHRDGWEASTQMPFAIGRRLLTSSIQSGIIKCLQAIHWSTSIKPTKSALPASHWLAFSNILGPPSGAAKGTTTTPHWPPSLNQ